MTHEDFDAREYTVQVSKVIDENGVEYYSAMAPAFGAKCSVDEDSPQAALEAMYELIPALADSFRERGLPIPSPDIADQRKAG